MGGSTTQISHFTFLKNFKKIPGLATYLPYNEEAYDCIHTQRKSKPAELVAVAGVAFTAVVDFTMLVVAVVVVGGVVVVVGCGDVGELPSKQMFIENPLLVKEASEVKRTLKMYTNEYGFTQ